MFARTGLRALKEVLQMALVVQAGNPGKRGKVAVDSLRSAFHAEAGRLAGVWSPLTPHSGAAKEQSWGRAPLVPPS